MKILLLICLYFPFKRNNIRLLIQINNVLVQVSKHKMFYIEIQIIMKH